VAIVGSELSREKGAEHRLQKSDIPNCKKVGIRPTLLTFEDLPLNEEIMKKEER
jgi:hypothetical protein